ncbi:MAG: L-threonine 3-dehydrogenase, partial [Alphaproteobacteria bacterium]|nr:L-threonine 3-dehydrogenase [Alphaproteobacteria bacterium]
MKSLAKIKSEPGIWMQDNPVPAIGPNDVKIKIKKSA